MCKLPRWRLAVKSYCMTYIHTYIHTYRQTDKQTRPKSYTMPLRRWSEIQTNIQHMQLIRVLHIVVAYKLQLTVYRHDMKCKLAISSLLCVTINCLMIGDHVKMLLTWWWWTVFSAITDSHEKFSKTSRNSSSPTAVRHRCCRTARKAAKHKTCHQYFAHYARQ